MATRSGDSMRKAMVQNLASGVVKKRQQAGRSPRRLATRRLAGRQASGGGTPASPGLVPGVLPGAGTGITDIKTPSGGTPASPALVVRDEIPGAGVGIGTSGYRAWGYRKP